MRPIVSAYARIPNRWFNYVALIGISFSVGWGLGHPGCWAVPW